ncbi:Nucleoid occlusion protein [Clostridium sp. N3C]|uniref:nucleoid occlusion protein n=1 Tax=Clostridium sp. N3C TaxID=1776758 RepID=UPI00092DFBF1|nr:nucleoid occlusion protein [Clostridium sp. N3C]NLZ34589.1 nucleoid occlusion protein [Clostridiales bacterium]SCN26556.1 Nucleoid occlusion protein [Clostridium sp. N3C]
MQKEIVYITPEQILPNLYQPRKTFNDDTIEELAQSIKAYGIIQPLSVRKMGNDSFELVAGERRLRAAKKAGLTKVPAIIVDITDKESAAIALLENLQREDLNYIEEAEAYYNLIRDHSYTQEQLAETIGKKQSTIANKLRLLKLSQEVRKMLLENDLTERHARALLKLSEEEDQIRVLNFVIEKKLNVKETEKYIENELNKKAVKEVADGKKKIKGIFSPKLYINTIKEVFDKFGVNAEYKSKDYDDYVEVTVKIPKK